MSGVKNSKRYLFVFFLTFSLAFSPINFSFLSQVFSAQGETIPEEAITGSMVWSENRVVRGVVTVKSGATLTIKKGVTIEFDGQAWIDVNGKLLIEGTPGQPVTLKKKDADAGDFFVISAISSGSISVRNADVSGGGRAKDVSYVKENRQRYFFQRAEAYWIYNGTFSALYGGTLDIEGVNLHNNALAIYTDRYSDYRTKVWRSKFSGNEIDLVNNSGYNRADLRYNWWGSEAGPEKYVPKPDEYWAPEYQKITGKADVSDWAKSEHFKNPVIVIPGIMGSWKWMDSSDLVLDPIFGTYDTLVETLEKNGYTEGADLFLFPYEWRMSNVETAKLLKTKVDRIKAATKWPRVDIVAHSMGGLVAREYIETLYGGDSVDQLITLGTPHDGSPEGYLTWDGGEFYDSSYIRKYFANKIFQQEAEENGYETTFDYIRKAPIASVRELLPAYSYLRANETGEMRTYPDMYPKNTFIEKLKASSGMEKLAPVLFTNIVGKTDGNDTISVLRVSGPSIELLNDPEKAVLWGHGKPDGYDSLFGDQGLELGAGDGTVPVDSAKGIVSDETIEMASSHGDLPAAAAKTVFNVLTGFDAVTEVPKKEQVNSLFSVFVFSPIDIQIISPSGKRLGKNFDADGVYDEIPGAFYTGYATKNEFVTIPNPEKGKYKILTQGTGSGYYRIEATNIQEDASGKAEESVATMTGVTELGQEAENKVEIKTTGVVVFDTTPPEASIRFNPVTKKLDVAGEDDVSDTVSVAMTGESATLKDEANNMTVVTFAKNEAGKQIKFEMKSLAYDGIAALPFFATLNYEWSLEKTGDVKMLNELAVVGGIQVQAHYLAKDNATVITKTENSVTTSETKSGLVVLRLVTEKGSVKINYLNINLI